MAFPNFLEIKNLIDEQAEAIFQTFGAKESLGLIDFLSGLGGRECVLQRLSCATETCIRGSL